MKEWKELFSDYAKDNKEEFLEMLREFAQIPAPSGREFRRADYLANKLKEIGAEDVIVDRAGNVLLLMGDDGSCPVRTYAAHLDVVFPDETPLPLREDEEKIYCPGIGDDTASMCALFYTVKYMLEKWTKQQIDKWLDGEAALFAWNTCEEGLGNLKGTKEICRHFGSRMKSFVTIDHQIGSLVTQAVGSMRYRIRVETEGGHSFGKFGNANAIAQMAEIIQCLYTIKVPKDGKTTYNVGTIQGGTSVNTIAQDCELLYEFRSDKRENLKYMAETFDLVMKSFRDIGWRIDTELLGERPCGGLVDQEAQEALIKRAGDALELVTGKRPECMMGSTDCNIPLSLGIPSVCIGSYMGALSHTREEYVVKESLEPGLVITLLTILG